MAAAFQQILFAPGEDLVLNFTMTQADGVTPQNGSISTYTLTFTARDKDGKVQVTCTIGTGISITDNGGVSTPGKYAVTVTAAQTALFGPPPSIGNFDVWRTNVGLKAQLALGQFKAGPQYLVG